MAADTAYKKIERWLRLYYRNEFKIRIATRKEALRFPPGTADELGVKVQTSYSNESPQEKLVAKMADDLLLNQLERLESIIIQFIEGCSKDEQELLILRYKEDKSWAYISDVLPYSRRSLFRMRDDLINRLGSLLAVFI